MDEELLPNTAFTEAADMDTPPERLAELAHYAVLQPLIAANPATLAMVLAQLSEAGEVAVRRSVAQNPNASLQVLGRLAGEFPREFLRNPLLPILNMTRPAFIKELPFLAWASLLRFEYLSPAWFQQLKTDIRYQRSQPVIWKLVQLHVNQTGKVRKPLALTSTGKTPRPWRAVVRDELNNDQKFALQPTVPDPVNETETFLLFVLLFPHVVPMLKEPWVQVARTSPRQAGIVLSSSMAVGSKTLALLLSEKDIFVRCQVACHPHTPEKILGRLAMSRQPEVRRAVASNPRTPLENIYTLLRDPQSAVRRAVVSHRALTQEDYEILALDENSTVRSALATLPRIDRELLVRLAGDPAAPVRAAVARNLNTPQEALASLAGDAEAGVRVAAAGNPRLPVDLHSKLLGDPEEAVRASFSGNACISEHEAARLAQDLSPAVRKSLAANPRTPLHLLNQFWQTGEMEIWHGLARHPLLSPDLLAQLAQQGDLRVRAAVAAHKHTPLEVLYDLAQEDRREIWYSLAANPHTPLDVLARALAEPDIELWLRLFNHPVMIRNRRGPFLALLARKLQLLITTNSLPDWLRRVVFQYYTALPATLLEPFASSPYWEERYLAARHPHISEALIDELAHDGICYVRTAAQDMLASRACAQSARRSFLRATFELVKSWWSSH